MNKAALITGGSSGIGFELARQFAKNGYSLILVARDQKRLEEAAEKVSTEHKVNITTIAKDLSDPNTPIEIYHELKERRLDIEVLANNAGFATQGSFVKTDFQKELNMIQVNISALTHLTKLFLPDLIARGKGKILNVASTAAFQPGPFFAVYFATKAYVLSFSEALAEETRNTGVSVTALCPGPTKSGFSKRAGTEGKGFFREGEMLEAKDVAMIGFNGLMKKKSVVITGFRNKFLIFMLRLTPRATVARVVSYLQSRRSN